MKRIYSIIILLFLLLIPFKINAYEDGISKYYIDMTVEENGSLHVKELIILAGDFNGFERIINYKNLVSMDFNGSLDSFRGSDIYNGTGINLISIKDINVNSSSSFDTIYNSGFLFQPVVSASLGDYGKYIKTITNIGEKYRIYNPDEGKKKGFYIEYELENFGVVHNDVGEVAINIFDSLNEYVDILEMKIHIPGNKNLLRGWAHGPLTGQITLVNNNLIEVRATKVEPNKPIDVRFAFDKEVISESTKFSNVSALDKIIEVETEWANEANAEREQVRLQLETEAKQLVNIAKENPTRENYNNALDSVIYLPGGEVKTNLHQELNEVLKIIKAEESFYTKIIISIFSVWFIGLICLIYFIYKKYDKEYQPEFKGHYYRDIPENYGPEVLGYLLNKKITPNELSASIMNLVNKKVIGVERIKEGKKIEYVFQKTNSDSSITIPEQRALTLLFSGGEEIALSDFKYTAKSNYESFLSDYDDWKLQACALSQSKEFFEKKNKKYWAVLYSILGFILIFVLYRNYINFLIYVVLFLLSLGSMIYFLTITRRSKKGNDDYSKWMGLKRFLKDFSTMDTKSLPEVALWEKYLVYAMPLGCAKKLSKDMQLKIQEIGIYEPSVIDMYDMGYMINLNRVLNSTMISSVQAAQAEQTRERMSEISNSSSSSGGGFGGGFSSGGGSFGGGGGGGRF